MISRGFAPVFNPISSSVPIFISQNGAAIMNFKRKLLLKTIIENLNFTAQK